MKNVNRSIPILTALVVVFFTTCGKKESVPVTNVTLDQITLDLAVGAAHTLKETVSPADASDKGVNWSSNNESVATVANGKVTAKAAGTAVITVKSNSNPDKSATCTVLASIKLGVTSTSPTLFKGVAASANFTVNGTELTAANVGTIKLNNIACTTSGTINAGGTQITGVDCSNVTIPADYAEKTVPLSFTGGLATYNVPIGNRVIFNSSGSWTVPAGITSIYAFVVGGGGGGGADNGAGGGGGYIRQGTIATIPGDNYTITVGGGGDEGILSYIAGTGSPSSITNQNGDVVLLSAQGGEGASDVAGKGSSGGGAYNIDVGGAGGSNCNNGGDGTGGKIAKGAKANNDNREKGGGTATGVLYQCTDAMSGIAYGGGGGGASNYEAAGGGGNSGGSAGNKKENTKHSEGGSGVANTGGGGGGSGYSSYHGGKGGSGIVIIYYE